MEHPKPNHQDGKSAWKSETDARRAAQLRFTTDEDDIKEIVYDGFEPMMHKVLFAGESRMPGVLSGIPRRTVEAERQRNPEYLTDEEFEALDQACGEIASMLTDKVVTKEF